MNIDKLMKSHDRNSNEIWVNEFTEDSARDFREAVLDAAKVDPRKPIVVYIDSYGGLADALASMIETMDAVPNPFVTVAVGKAMSCGAILLSHGDVRFCGRLSRIMVHEVSGGAAGDTHDVHADAVELKRINKLLMGLLARNCDIKGGYDAIRKIIKDRDGRDYYMSADAAIKFGIVDFIGLPKVERVNLYQVSVIPEKKRLSKPVKADNNRKSTKKKKPDTKR